MADDSNDPKNLDICRQHIVFQHFPMPRLVDNPGTWSVLNYKYGRLIARDANEVDWIYVIKSGEARVFKYLEPGHIDVQARRKKVQAMINSQSAFYRKKKILNFVEEREYIKSSYTPHRYHPTVRPIMSAPAGATRQGDLLHSDRRDVSTCIPGMRYGRGQRESSSYASRVGDSRLTSAVFGPSDSRRSSAYVSANNSRRNSAFVQPESRRNSAFVQPESRRSSERPSIVSKRSDVEAEDGTAAADGERVGDSSKTHVRLPRLQLEEAEGDAGPPTISMISCGDEDGTGLDAQAQNIPRESNDGQIDEKSLAVSETIQDLGHLSCRSESVAGDKRRRSSAVPVNNARNINSNINSGSKAVPRLDMPSLDQNDKQNAHPGRSVQVKGGRGRSGSFIKTPVSGTSRSLLSGKGTGSQVIQVGNHTLPAFVQVETLHPGQVFGLRACLDPEERGPSVSLVSGECEVLQINKKFFMKHCDDAIYSLIRLKAKPFPSQEDLIDRLDVNMKWEEYKQQTLEDFLQRCKRLDR